MNLPGVDKAFTYMDKAYLQNVCLGFLYFGDLRSGQFCDLTCNMH